VTLTDHHPAPRGLAPDATIADVIRSDCGDCAEREEDQAYLVI